MVIWAFMKLFEPLEKMAESEDLKIIGEAYKAGKDILK
jgi:hypothetical protein